MKRTLSVFLTLALCCAAVFAIAPAAEAAAPEKVEVAYAGTNYEIWNGTAGDDIVVFGDVTQAYSVETNAATGAAYVVGEFAAPVVIQKITVTVNHKNANRARAASVYGSADGETWVKIATAPDSGWAQGTAVSVSVNSAAAFRYVKYEQAASLVGYWFTVGGIEVYGAEVTGELQEVSFVSYSGGSYDEGSANAEQVFVPDNELIWNSADIAENGGEAWVVGKFASPTVMRQVCLVGHPTLLGRMPGVTVEGSADGEHWTVLNSVSETPDTAGVVLRVEDETAYSYIRVKKTGEDGGLFSLKNVSVFGYTVTPVFRAYQETVPANGAQSVRLIAALNTLNYSEIGFRVSAAYTDPDTNESKTVSIDQSCAYAYHSLTASEADGTVDTVTAGELGGTYLYALVINGVPTDVGELVFTVTPYAVQGENELVGETAYVTYRNGVAVVPEA